MESAPYLAIVVPAYNASATIAETLRSIQEQTALSRIAAVYVADDRSTDNTVETARTAWTSDVPLIISQNQVNSGERTTVNNLVNSLPPHITWFFILHADDIAKPNWVAVISEEIARAGPKVLTYTASYDVLYADGHLETGEDFGIERKVIIEGSMQSIRNTIVQGCWFKISSCAIQVEGFRALQGFQTDMPQLGDWEFTLRAMRAGWTIEYIPMCLSIYRRHAQSVSAISYRDHRDVREAIRIFTAFRGSMPRTLVLRVHLTQIYYLLRRSAQAVVAGNFKRLKSAATVSLQVWASLFRNMIRA